VVAVLFHGDLVTVISVLFRCSGDVFGACWCCGGGGVDLDVFGVVWLW
jgi:hypothetical protein